MTAQASSPAVALTIGGSDSGGACGIQADLRTFAFLGVHGTSALTIVTAQNTLGVRSAVPLDAGFVLAQIEAVLADYPVTAVKTGMLARLDVIEAVSGLAASGRLPRLVVDPVLVNAAGVSIFGAEVIDAYRRLLLPHAMLVTPNREELALLVGSPVSSPADLTAAAIGLAESAGCAVLAKGGRFEGGDTVSDVAVLADGTASTLSKDRVITSNVAGSGDTLSAAITAHLADGAELMAAIEAAQTVVANALAGAATWHLGAGSGPLNLLDSR